MITKETVVTCESGLFSKQASLFIQKAYDFKSSIWVEVENRRVNAKSLLGVLSMGINKGATVNLIAEGPDEEAAVNALSEILVKDLY